MLADGTYDIFVVDADDGPVEDGSAKGTIELTLTIVGGRHKGEVVMVRADGLARDTIDLMGMPGVLQVDAGTPHIEID